MRSDVISALCNSSSRLIRFLSAGGLVRTELMCQLLADVTGKTALRADDADATVRGAWMSASHSLDLVASWEEAWGRVRGAKEMIFHPVPELTERYRRQSEHMERLYRAVRETDR